VCILFVGAEQLARGKSVSGGVLVGVSVLLGVGNLWLLLRERRQRASGPRG
jgi:hypothetical protein